MFCLAHFVPSQALFGLPEGIKCPNHQVTFPTRSWTPAPSKPCSGFTSLPNPCLMFANPLPRFVQASSFVHFLGWTLPRASAHLRAECRVWKCREICLHPCKNPPSAEKGTGGWSGTGVRFSLFYHFLQRAPKEPGNYKLTHGLLGCYNSLLIKIR